MKSIILLLALAGTLMAGRMPTWDEVQGNRHVPVKPAEPPCDTPEPATIGLMGAGLIAIMVAKHWRAK